MRVPKVATRLRVVLDGAALACLLAIGRWSLGRSRAHDALAKDRAALRAAEGADAPADEGLRLVGRQLVEVRDHVDRILASVPALRGKDFVSQTKLGAEDGVARLVRRGLLRVVALHVGAARSTREVGECQLVRWPMLAARHDASLEAVQVQSVLAVGTEPRATLCILFD